MDALWVAKTGLDAQQTRMSVVSNNLANVNTNGYKKGRAIFEDLLYQNVSQAGGATNVQFVDAKLALVVTPHATPDNKIFMKIKATKNAPDTSLLGAGGQPSIRKNEAETEILLNDGETAVIGGILVIDRGSTITKIPFFGDLQLIGWLFRSKATREEKRELLIVITPRVLRPDVV